MVQSVAEQIAQESQDNILAASAISILDSARVVEGDISIDLPYSSDSYIFAVLVVSIIPVLIIYPYLQRYFTRGVNLGGVKE